MPHDSNNSSGTGCLIGLAVAVAIPVTVFGGILIGNSRNPQCGTPGDSGWLRGLSAQSFSGLSQVSWFGWRCGAEPIRSRNAPNVRRVK
jgi:hypothetical protein